MSFYNCLIESNHVVNKD